MKSLYRTCKDNALLDALLQRGYEVIFTVPESQVLRTIKGRGYAGKLPKDTEWLLPHGWRELEWAQETPTQWVATASGGACCIIDMSAGGFTLWHRGHSSRHKSLEEAKETAWGLERVVLMSKL